MPVVTVTKDANGTIEAEPAFTPAEVGDILGCGRWLPARRARAGLWPYHESATGRITFTLGDLAGIVDMLAHLYPAHEPAGPHRLNPCPRPVVFVDPRRDATGRA